jgi:hypothetical protein
MSLDRLPRTAAEAMENARRMGLRLETVESVGRNFGKTCIPEPLPQAPMMHLPPAPAQPAIPDLDADRDEIRVLAQHRLWEDSRGRAFVPWPDLAEITGPMLAGHLWVWGARPSNGKSTLMRNLCARLLNRAHGFVYFGTEEAADTQLIAFVALLVGLDPSLVVGSEWHELPADARKRMHDGLEMFGKDPLTRNAYFYEQSRPSLADLTKAAEFAATREIELFVIDHFHRMWLDPAARDITSSLTENVRAIKDLAVRFGLTIHLAAQITRGKDSVLDPYVPPPLGGYKGTGALEEEPDVALAAWRPLQNGLTVAREHAFRRGEIRAQDVVRDNVMAVRVNKHRRNGSNNGRTAYLRVAHGVVDSISEDAEWDRAAQR